MRGKQHGAHVALRMVSWDGPHPEAGDFLVTEAGSGYYVLDARLNDRGAGPVDCIKFDPARIPSDARIHGMYWTPRGRRR